MKRYLFFILSSVAINLLAQEPILPIPKKVIFNKEKAKLGKKLFFDTMLSRNKTINCASCHMLEAGGDDNLQYSFGINGQKGSINSPTVYNAVFNFRQFWDGRAPDLQKQAEGPIENPVEMGFNFKELIKRLNKTAYKKEFANIYKDGITKANITDAIAEYEKTLITPNAPFDRYLRGEKNAISKEQKRGYEIFKTKGCITCHHGINIGGNLYSKFGIFQDNKSGNLGRYNITKQARDRYFFKVPSLRNIAKTAPYFHDGRTYSLTKAIEIMTECQLGRKVTKKEIQELVSFLKSLTGEIPQEAKE